MTGPVTERSPGGVWDNVWKGVWWLLTSIPIGESYRDRLQLRHFVNLHKGLTFFIVGLLSYLYGRFTYPIAAYMGVHGSYGFLWLAKEEIYRDASWETPCTLGSGVFLFIGMALFWSSPFIIISGGPSVEPSPEQVCFLVLAYSIGLWMHHTSDAQKYFVLRAKKGLITNGMFANCRNPNYLGEMIIYGSFAGFSCNHPLYYVPWVNLLIVWTCLFYPSWLAKDRSMSRYPEWPEYISRSGLIIPWFFGGSKKAD